MSGYYIYLLSSLPMLHFGIRAPFSSQRLHAMCRGLVSEDDMAAIEAATLDGIIDYRGPQAILKKFRSFEMALRNELVKIRASRKHIDPLKYIRQDGESDIAINHFAINAYRATSMLEAERILDRARWHTLDELTLGRYFEIANLVSFGIKLSILEKWDSINSADNNTAALERYGIR